jgi:stringent starvation protein B
MTPSRPYLIRALYEWIVDNQLTPHLLVDATLEGVSVPLQSVEDGRIVLNVSPTATQNLLLGNDAVQFHARFGGVDTAVKVPTDAVLAIYARENGQGMMFAEETGSEPTPPEGGGPESGKGKPALKLVK